jgi:hypothetical protein
MSSLLSSEISSLPVFLNREPYIVEMSDFFSEQAENALEGDLALMAPSELESSGFSSDGGPYYYNAHGGVYLGQAQYTDLIPPGNYHETLSTTFPANGYSIAPLGPAVPFIQPNIDGNAQARLQESLQLPLPSRSPSIRSESPEAADLSRYGVRKANGRWSCARPGCSSQSTFTRACDLRKHYNRHNKHLFCRREGCPQATEGGFSSKKDRARHEAKHDPRITCEWEGCDRVFSRVDNMKDHVRRIHQRSCR